MTKRFAGLKSFGSKAVSVIASGALALSLTPAIALADPGLQAQSASLYAQADDQPRAYTYDNASGKSITFSGTDSITASLDATAKQYSAKLVSQSGNKYVYEGIAHSDGGAHYKAYSLYTAITTDAAGVITAIDLYSGNDTYAGAWGYAGGKTPAPIEGYLPDGVTFTAEKQSETGDSEVYKPALGGKVSEYGSTVAAISLMKVGTDGKLAKVGTTTSDSTSTDLYERPVTVPSANSGNKSVNARSGDTGASEPTWESGAPEGTWDATAGTLSAKNANLAKVTYYIGDESMPFNAYFSMGDDAASANTYMNSIAKTTWQSVPEEGYDTNRDRWTHIMGTVALRELASWNAAMNDSKLSTDLDGEIATLDTVSGATKTATPFVGALNLAKATGKVKGVAEDVAFTIDKSTSLPTVDVSGNLKDRSTVVANSDGTHTLNVVFPYQDIKRNDRYGVELLDVQVYALGDKKVGTQGMMQLAKQSTPAEDADSDASDVAYTALKTYSPESERLNETTSTDKRTKETITTYSWASDTAAAGTYITAVDDSNIKFEYEPSDSPLKVTTKNKNITHVVMRYEIGHGKIAVAYDLANMSKVASVSGQLAAANQANPTSVTAARAAYDALPYDVRPFTTGISNLLTQEKALKAKEAADKEAAAKKAAEEAAAKKAAEEAAAQKAAEEAAAKKAAEEAAAKAAAEAAAKTVKANEVKTVSGQTFKVTKVATDKAQGTVTFTAAKNAKSVTVPATVTLNDGKTYKVTKVAANSFAGSKIRSVTIGKNVTKIAAKAFAKSKATKVTVKSTSLKKSSVKNCFKGAKKMKTVKVPKKKLKAYKKIFTKKNTGASKKLKVKK